MLLVPRSCLESKKDLPRVYRSVVAATLAILGMFTLTPNSFGQFTADNFAVVRVGNGTTTLNNSGFQASIFQFNLGLQVVDNTGTAAAYNASSSTAISTIATGTAGLQLSGSATSDGHLSLSADRSTLMLAGYSNTAGAASIGGSSNRSIARINASSGTSTVQVITGGPFGTGNHRAAASIDGTQVWVTGNATGVVTGSNTATTNAELTTVTSTNTNNRAVGIYGSTNSLFFSAAAGTSGLYAVNPGSAAPTTTGQTATNIIAGNTQSFWLADRDATTSYAGTGLDTAYLIGVTAGRIDKYEFDGSAWVARGTATISGASASSGFITGRVNGSSIDLLGVFDLSTGLSNNLLYSASDTSAFGSSISLTGITTLAAGTNFAFRGATYLTPIPEPTGILLAVAGGAWGFRRWRRKQQSAC